MIKAVLTNQAAFSFWAVCKKNQNKKSDIYIEKIGLLVSISHQKSTPTSQAGGEFSVTGS